MHAAGRGAWTASAAAVLRRPWVRCGAAADAKENRDVAARSKRKTSPGVERGGHGMLQSRVGLLELLVGGWGRAAQTQRQRAAGAAWPWGRRAGPRGLCAGARHA